MTKTEADPSTESALRVESSDSGQLWRVILARPKANIIDAEMIGLLAQTFKRARNEKHLKLITIEGEGKHFSFGASVEEHMPEQCAEMLKGLHAMLVDLHDCNVICHALVRGQCLGAGLELASFCHRVIATPEAALGQPEIQLGVFAPVATAILTDRIGRGRAEDLCFSGRSIKAEEAFQWGLVDELASDPWEASHEYFHKHLEPRSASSLRHAVRAMRSEFGTRFRNRIAQLEQAYLEDLMSSHDAVEGLQAFIEKRKPQWSDE